MNYTYKINNNKKEILNNTTISKNIKTVHAKAVGSVVVSTRDVSSENNNIVNNVIYNNFINNYCTAYHPSLWITTVLVNKSINNHYYIPYASRSFNTENSILYTIDSFYTEKGQAS